MAGEIGVDISGLIRNKSAFVYLPELANVPVCPQCKEEAADIGQMIICLMPILDTNPQSATCGKMVVRSRGSCLKCGYFGPVIVEL